MNLMEIFHFEGDFERHNTIKTTIMLIALLAFTFFLAYIHDKPLSFIPLALFFIFFLNAKIETVITDDNDVVIRNVFKIEFRFTYSEIIAFHGNRGLCLFALKKKCIPFLFSGTAIVAETTQQLLALLEEKTKRKRCFNKKKKKSGK